MDDGKPNFGHVVPNFLPSMGTTWKYVEVVPIGVETSLAQTDWALIYFQPIALHPISQFR